MLHSQEAAEHGVQLITFGRCLSVFDAQGNIKKRVIKPCYGKKCESSTIIGTLETMLRNIAGKRLLETLLLAVTPNITHTSQRLLHIFERWTREHLGMIPVTQAEVKLLRRYEMLFKYEIMTTNNAVEPQQLAMDQEVIEALFERDRSPTRILFMSSLDYAKLETGRRDVGVQVHLSLPRIRSLRQPRIPVRMRKYIP